MRHRPFQKEKTRPAAWPRKILHIDMDAFFAAIEQRDRPELRGKPVVVGGRPNGRGVVSTASYEARRFGIHSAMPAAEAKRRCPEAVFLRPNMEKYVEVSDAVHHIMSKYTDVIEHVGIDEAYLDIGKNTLATDDPILLARMIQQNIYGATRLTASVGLAVNKYLSKIASDMNKPAGLTVVRPDEIQTFLHHLPVRKIPGVGPVSEKELNNMQIRTIGELALVDRPRLVTLFGKWGHTLHERARGIDERPLETESEPKQLGAEETFERDVIEYAFMDKKISELAEEVAERLRDYAVRAKTVTLKIKYADFTVITRSRTLAAPFTDAETMCVEARALLREKTEAGRRPVRLIGVSASHLIWPGGADKAHTKEDGVFELWK